MKLARLVCAALALTLVACWTTGSWACDDSKATAASAKAARSTSKATAAVAASKAGACTAEMAARCTPEMMAACKASMAAGGPDLCLGMKASAASANGACGARVTAVAAGSGTCGFKGTSAGAAGGQCSAHGMASMAATGGHEDCEACLDMADCSGALDAAHAHRQTVRLKNGVMYVYTADSPRTVNAVQAAVARRVDRMARLVSSGDKARLCAECKAMRGAVASGKLSREVINIEGGSLTLVTSSDPAVVAKLHAMTDQKVAARVKS